MQGFFFSLGLQAIPFKMGDNKSMAAEMLRRFSFDPRQRALEFFVRVRVDDDELLSVQGSVFSNLAASTARLHKHTSEDEKQEANI